MRRGRELYTRSAAAALAAVALAGCTSSVHVAMTSATATSAQLARSSAHASTPVPSTTKSVNPAPALFDGLSVAARSITSAHVRVEIVVNADIVTATVDERVREGAVTEARLALGLPNEHNRLPVEHYLVVLAPGGLYARVPSSSRPKRPWVSLDSRPASVSKQLTGELSAISDLALAYSSPSYYTDLRAASSDVRARIPLTDNGTHVTPYDFYLDPSTLVDIVARASMSGVSTCTAEIEVDAQHRTIYYDHHYDDPDNASVDVTFSRYDVSVSVAAPPKSKIA